MNRGTHEHRLTHARNTADQGKLTTAAPSYLKDAFKSPQLLLPATLTVL